MSRAPDTWILTADCPSVLGTVDAVTRFVFEQGCYCLLYTSDAADE